MNRLQNAICRTVFAGAGFVALIFLAQPSGAASTTAPDVAATQPTSTLTDAPLPHDPADICGQFDNGLHYLIRKNADPPGKVFLNLAVRTGSLNETAKQNGLAHFLEHMAFKGSAHYAPTKLIPMLQHLGMRFGADTNAHTNQYETVFKLSMPDTKPETTELALTIFSDYANGLSLFPIQIESERRVILEEVRSRTNVALREHNDLYNQLFPGTQMAVHNVLGDPDILKTAQQPLFQEYWNQWYRPEKMTLIVVGDVDPDAIIAQARPILGTFTARTPAKEPTSAGLAPFASPRVIVMTDPEQVAGDVNLFNLQPVRPLGTTTLQYRHLLIENLAKSIVNRRLSDLIAAGNCPMQGASISSGDVLHDGYMVSGVARGEPQDWQKLLEGLIVQLSRGINHGFSQDELDTARSSLIGGTAQLARTDSTRDSLALVTSLTTAVDTDQPLMSNLQRFQLARKLLADVTVEELQAAFTADFKNGNYAYVIKLPPPVEGQKLPTEQEVFAVANAAWLEKTATSEPTTSSVAKLLLDEPTPGAVASRVLNTDLKVTTVTFENGVVLHHRFSDYKKDQVLIQIDLPGGALEETAGNQGISAVASLIVSHPATSRLSSLQLHEMFSNINVRVRGGIGLDSLSISVTGSHRGVPTGLRLVNAILTDGKLEQSTVDDWKRSQLQALRSKPMLAEPQLGDAFSSTVMGGDFRFGSWTAQNIEHQQREAAEAWFKRIAEHSAMEVSVVGDVTAEDTIQLISRYLGSLPSRTGTFADLDPVRQFARAPGPFVKTVHYHGIEPKALVTAGFIGCDEHDSQRRPLGLAALILTDRMIQRIRFDQQLVYSINCSSAPGRVVGGVGMLSASAPTDPHNADKLADEILSIIKEFAANGPSDDELATARKQIANQLATQLKEPAYWLTQITELSYHHKSLEDLAQLPDVYQTFTADQVRDAVRKYATDDRVVRLVVLPDEPTTQPNHN